MKILTYTTVDRVFARLSRYMDITNEVGIIEDIGDALDHMSVVQQYVETVEFALVENFTCQVPKHCNSIIQIARNNKYIPSVNESCIKPCDAVTSLGTQGNTGPSIPVALDENGEPLHEYELAYYRPFFDLQYEYLGWAHSSLYKENFTPVNLKTHSFFNEFVCKDELSIYKPGCNDEYNIIEGKTLKFSFEKGQIAIAFNRQKFDSNGYPMIPDDVSFISAIVNYVLKEKFSQEYYAGRQGAADKMNKAELDWTWYCGQAQNKVMMLHGEDEHENFRKQRGYLLPPKNRFMGFFGKLSRQENRDRYKS